MKTSAILLLCMLGAAVFSTVFCSSAIGPDNCCFRFYPKQIPRGKIQSYSLADNRCPRSAIILKTIKGSKVCVDPSKPWVKNVRLSVDQRSF
ncbi:C-C motif chemokine 7 [Oryzias melastigma]|uniref:C-C motif chemokine n=1 Tax=Oryzias melastigma TaxID=30732 RepID=A0A3B3BC02_ORYME|nr:C-C motif chemokine 7 [Oryzias melastigma]